MANHPKDVKITEEHPKTLLREKHVEYIVSYSKKKDDFEYTMTEHIRMSGMYWGITAIDLLGCLGRMDHTEIVSFIQQCQDKTSGGISPSIDHDPHMLSTLSAVQILVLLDSVSSIDVDGVVRYVSGLQNSDGSFCGDKWGEVDTRFSFCAVACLRLLVRELAQIWEPRYIEKSSDIPIGYQLTVPSLNRLDSINREKSVEFVMKCSNVDGGFGTRPGSETHAGQIYCCLGMLSILNELDRVDADQLGWWLCERQLPSGGLNGRPEKLPDVCYSWWVLSSLTLLNRLHWINADKMKTFILATQDPETGGFTDRPGDMPDLYHTLFGLAGLSLLGDTSLKRINPVFCMPQYIIDKLNITTRTIDDELDA